MDVITSLVIIVMAEACFRKVVAPNELFVRYPSEDGDRWHLEQAEDRLRWMINQAKTKSDDQIRSQKGKWRFRNLDPIDDSQRVSALVMMAQQNIPRRLRIPNELHQAIHEYSDYNEIRTLFRILTSSEDRKGVLGFESYGEMHQEYPTKLDKVRYLKHFRQFRDGEEKEDNESDEDNAWFDPQTIKFGSNGDHNQFIIGINWTPVVTVPYGAYPSHDPKSINWRAIGGLKHLRYLRLDYLKLNVSMHDISSLPDSLRLMGIRRCAWTESSGNVDVSLFPPGLREFHGCECEGMTGSLNLAAPSSNLTDLRLEETEIQDVSGLHAMPPSFESLYLSGPRLNISKSDFELLILRRILFRIKNA